MPDPCPGGPATGPVPDHSVFTSLLRDVVVLDTEKSGVKTSLVNYEKINANPARLQQYTLSLCNVDLQAITDKKALLALWANAYNALMFNIVCHYNPSSSVKQLHEIVSSGSIWKELLGTVGGQKVSLDMIEHGIIRAGLAAEVGVSGRVHSALVCASLSCPDIQNEAFEANTIVAQVTKATNAWLMNPTKNPGPDINGDIYLSKIFSWFGGDFVAESGSVAKFLRANSNWTDAQVPLDVRILYTEYNWDVNRVSANGAQGMASGTMLIPLLVFMAMAQLQ